jgi:hypothetical protein
MLCLWWIKQQWKGNAVQFLGGRSFISRSKMRETRPNPLGSFFFLLSKAQRPVRCGRQAQRNLTVNSSISSRLLVLGSCLPVGRQGSFFFLLAKAQRNLTANSSTSCLPVGRQASRLLPLVSRFLPLGSHFLLLDSFFLSIANKICFPSLPKPSSSPMRLLL